MFGFIKRVRLLQRVREYMCEEGFELESLPPRVRQGIVASVDLCRKKDGNEYDVVIRLCLDMVLYLHSKHDGSLANLAYGNKVSWVNRATAATKLVSGNCYFEQTEAFALMAASILMDVDPDSESVEGL